MAEDAVVPEVVAEDAFAEEELNIVEYRLCAG